MAILEKITLYQFRNYTHGVYELPHNITCVTGRNGSGKTNFLDAVYTLCYTKSYFTASVQQVVLHGTDGFRIEGRFRHRDQQEQLACKYKNARKEVSVNGVVYEKLSDHIGRYAAVMVAPDDIAIINEGSELRRKFADGILSQCDHAYLDALMQYQRVLLQRNALLKMYAQKPGSDLSQLDYYNNEMSRSGQYLYESRKAFIARFLPLLDQYYRLLSGGSEKAGMLYESDLHLKPLADWLDQNLQHDLRYQRTLRGSHKDDLEFQLDGISIKNFGSQGQKKSFLFALKLAQYEYIAQQSAHQPILLLDDIFEKLDQQRMEALLSIIGSEQFGQVILTDTHEARVQAAFGTDKDLGFIRVV